MPARRPHRIAKLYHAPRTIGFALAFLAGLLLFFEGLVAWEWLPLGVLILLVYPHLVYVRAKLVADGKAAELQHLLLDALLLGFWVAVIGFHVGLAFALLSAVSLNNAMLGGWRRLLLAIVLFLAGGGIGFAVSGLRFDPYSSQPVMLLSLLGILIYMVVVALLFHQQNKQMMKVQRQNEHRRNIFEQLARSGLDTAKAEDLETLLQSTLSHLRMVMPDALGMGLVVRESTRPGIIHGTFFLGYEAAAQQQWVDASIAVRADQGMSERACFQHPGTAYWFPVERTRSHMSAALVISLPKRQAPDTNTIELFLQQLAAALDNHALTRKLTALANTDGLTGLANRTRVDAWLAQAIRSSQSAHAHVFTVIMVDINGLKVLNDEHGHEAGDRLILAAAKVLRSACRETDLVGRTGGDEFVVLCPSTTCGNSRLVVERIRRAAADEHVAVMDLAGRPHMVDLSVSIGCADSCECAPRHVLRLADQRMYADKELHYRQRAVD